MVFLLLCTIIFLLWATLVYWPNRKISSFAKNLPGPLSLPLIGNAYLFFNNNGDYILETVKVIKKYPSPMKFFLGSKLIVVYSNPVQVEKILSTSKLTHKHDIYKYVKPYGGEGLITGSGADWKNARRLLQPLYNIQFVAECTKIFGKHTQLFLSHMDAKLNSPTYFNVEPLIHKYCSDIIGESILGTQLNTQKGENKEIMASFAKMYELVINRMTKPWLHLDWIYNLTSSKSQEIKVANHFNKFFGQMAETGKAALYKNVPLPVTEENDGFRPSLLDITDRIVNSPHLSDKNLVDNLITIFAASEDTMTATAAAGCVCFGMYPEYQEKAFAEIKTVLGGMEDTEIRYEHVVQMTYLDMCVKEVLRIFPIAPVILRKTISEFHIDNLHIPPECAILISIFNLHMNSNEWERPMEFYPDHFLPEAVKNRHVFSYIPFSAGPRGCIGKTFAQTSIKLLLANILRRFRIEAEGKYSDIYQKFKADISVRPICGYPIKLHRRIWN